VDSGLDGVVAVVVPGPIAVIRTLETASAETPARTLRMLPALYSP
jgi:hypothetical protein